MVASTLEPLVAPVHVCTLAPTDKNGLLFLCRVLVLGSEYGRWVQSTTNKLFGVLCISSYRWLVDSRVVEWYIKKVGNSATDGADNIYLVLSSIYVHQSTFFVVENF